MTPSLLFSFPHRAVRRRGAAYTLLVGLLVGASPAAAVGAATLPTHRPVVAKPFFLNITGTVRDAKGEGSPGVSVVLKGTTTGTTTDAQGVFRINLPTGNEVLVFSSIGFKKQEVLVSGRATLDVKMEEESSALNEIGRAHV